MKRNYKYLIIIANILLIASCKLDNYTPPSATIYGTITDQDGQQVQSDASGQGVKIIYVERGNFSSPSAQSINLKPDGSFEKGQIFPGTYDLSIRDANFQNQDTVRNFVVNSGRNELNFKVQAYIKVTNLSIVKNGNLVVAKFNLKTLGNNSMRVDKLQLFGYIDPIVSFGSQFGIQPVNANIQTLSRAPGVNEQFTLQIDLSLQGNTFTKYPTSTKFWFRVGALVLKADATAGSNPKWNYSEPVQLAIN